MKKKYVFKIMPFHHTHTHARTHTSILPPTHRVKFTTMLEMCVSRLFIGIQRQLGIDAEILHCLGLCQKAASQTQWARHFERRLEESGWILRKQLPMTLALWSLLSETEKLSSHTSFEWMWTLCVCLLQWCKGMANLHAKLAKQHWVDVQNLHRKLIFL